MPGRDFMDFLNYLIDKFKVIVDSVLNMLPKSPIVYCTKNKTISEYLGYVNYFIPVYLWISILEAWLTAIVIYFVVQVILRWIKVIE